MCRPHKYQVIKDVRCARNHEGEFWFAFSTESGLKDIGTSRTTEDEAWLDALAHAITGEVLP